MSPAGRRTAGSIGFSDQDGPKMAPRRPQDGPRLPRWRIMWAHGPQDGSKWPKMAPKMPPRLSKTPPRWPKRPLRRLRTSPRRPKSFKNLWFLYDFYNSPSERHGGSRRHLESPKGPPRRPKIAPKRPKMAPRRPQDGP